MMSRALRQISNLSRISRTLVTAYCLRLFGPVGNYLFLQDLASRDQPDSPFDNNSEMKKKEEKNEQKEFWNMLPRYRPGYYRKTPNECPRASSLF